STFGKRKRSVAVKPAPVAAANPTQARVIHLSVERLVTPSCRTSGADGVAGSTALLCGVDISPTRLPEGKGNAQVTPPRDVASRRSRSERLRERAGWAPRARLSLRAG